MDEPFSALDVLTAETLRTDLMELWSENKLPIRSILMVTHNIEEAVLMCDRILLLADNPGHIAAEFTIDMPRPRNRLVPRFTRPGGQHLCRHDGARRQPRAPARKARPCPIAFRHLGEYAGRPDGGAGGRPL